MNIRSTVQIVGYLAAAAAAGFALGLFVHSRWVGGGGGDNERGAVVTDDSELTFDELTTGLLPNETRVYNESPTQRECVDVPQFLINPSVDSARSRRDTTVEYRPLFTDPPGDAPSVSFGDRSGLRAIGQSRHRFLYLPISEEGEPLIDHDGQKTVVPAYSQAGRGYEFTYRYQRPAFELFAEATTAGQWWPPLRPSLDRIVGSAGVDVGLRWGEAQAQAGAHFGSELGPALRVEATWRFWSWTP